MLRSAVEALLQSSSAQIAAVASEGELKAVAETILRASNGTEDSIDRALDNGCVRALVLCGTGKFDGAYDMCAQNECHRGLPVWSRIGDRSAVLCSAADNRWKVCESREQCDTGTATVQSAPHSGKDWPHKVSWESVEGCRPVVVAERRVFLARTPGEKIGVTFAADHPSGLRVRAITQGTPAARAACSWCVGMRISSCCGEVVLASTSASAQLRSILEKNSGNVLLGFVPWPNDGAESPGKRRRGWFSSALARAEVEEQDRGPPAALTIALASAGVSLEESLRYNAADKEELVGTLGLDAEQSAAALRYYHDPASSSMGVSRKLSEPKPMQRRRSDPSDDVVRQGSVSPGGLFARLVPRGDDSSRLSPRAGEGPISPTTPRCATPRGDLNDSQLSPFAGSSRVAAAWRRVASVVTKGPAAQPRQWTRVEDNRVRELKALEAQSGLDDEQKQELQELEKGFEAFMAEGMKALASSPVSRRGRQDDPRRKSSLPEIQRVLSTVSHGDCPGIAEREASVVVFSEPQRSLEVKFTYSGGGGLEVSIGRGASCGAVRSLEYSSATDTISLPDCGKQVRVPAADANHIVGGLLCLARRSGIRHNLLPRGPPEWMPGDVARLHALRTRKQQMHSGRRASSFSDELSAELAALEAHYERCFPLSATGLASACAAVAVMAGAAAEHAPVALSPVSSIPTTPRSATVAELERSATPHEVSIALQPVDSDRLQMSLEASAR
eukprot:TRINITY_DN17826_c2_g1_i2.p1 TRINITY_DN17826_c2_g1~~TRINITY_DN17826_c2_g1_i2.p1  ORF type:complete len:731 (+),score=45.41 TRINITY_DN17826_c2_g1_i2:80-2272(+)